MAHWRFFKKRSLEFNHGLVVHHVVWAESSTWLRCQVRLGLLPLTDKKKFPQLPPAPALAPLSQPMFGDVDTCLLESRWNGAALGPCQRLEQWWLDWSLCLAIQPYEPRASLQKTPPNDSGVLLLAILRPPHRPDFGAGHTVEQLDSPTQRASHHALDLELDAPPS